MAMNTISALEGYNILEETGSAGPNLAWKLYLATRRGVIKSPHECYRVCVWLLDKRCLSTSNFPQPDIDSFYDIIRLDASILVKSIHVLKPLDENDSFMFMVTEPLLSSLANALEKKAMRPLEVKHGLLQLSECLEYFHQSHKPCYIHRSISPESILIDANGAWKLGGFGFAIPVDPDSSDLANAQHALAFRYPESDMEDPRLPLEPSLYYTAPELVRDSDLTLAEAFFADIFSLGCLSYHLISQRPLFDCHYNVKMDLNTSSSYLSIEAASFVPSAVVSCLEQMLSVDGSHRPTLDDFTGSPFFTDDTGLKALLTFLDHMLKGDSNQKSDFLKALPDVFKGFEDRVLQYKVLPPLCEELFKVAMQPTILPMVLTIAKSQEKSDFELSTLRSLLPVLESAEGDTLLLLVKHADIIIEKTSLEYLKSHVLPMLVRAYSNPVTRFQVEVLKKTVSLARHLDPQHVKQVIIPPVYNLARHTTVVVVRGNALLCLGQLIDLLDEKDVLIILQTIQEWTKVDQSSPTLKCILRVSKCIFKKYGAEFAVTHLLPLLTPHVTGNKLKDQQFAQYMHFFDDIFRKIEETRGVRRQEFAVEEDDGKVDFEEEVVEIDWAKVVRRLITTHNDVKTTMALEGYSENFKKSISLLRDRFLDARGIIDTVGKSPQAEANKQNVMKLADNLLSYDWHKLMKHLEYNVIQGAADGSDVQICFSMGEALSQMTCGTEISCKFWTLVRKFAGVFTKLLHYFQPGDLDDVDWLLYPGCESSGLDAEFVEHCQRKFDTFNQQEGDCMASSCEYENDNHSIGDLDL